MCTDAPEQLPAGLSDGTIHTDLAAVTPCPESGDLAAAPSRESRSEADPLRRVHALTRHVLAQLQSWLARPDTANARLMIVTRHAVSVSAYDGVPDLAHAAAWALIHTAQNEHPDRIILLDTDDTAASQDNLLAIASTRPAGEPQLALRNGVAHIPRLARTPTLTPPDAPDWQLGTTGKGDLTNLTLLPTDPPDDAGAGADPRSGTRRRAELPRRGRGVGRHRRRRPGRRSRRGGRRHRPRGHRCVPGMR